MALKWLIATATQGSADAFVENEFQTGLSNVTRTAFRIRRIEWGLPLLIGADCSFLVQLGRNSQAAITTTLGNPVINTVFRSMELTTSGMVVQDNSPWIAYARDEELLIVEESLFLRLDSTGTSASNSCACRIGYEQRTITENERLSIQAATSS